MYLYNNTSHIHCNEQELKFVVKLKFLEVFLFIYLTFLFALSSLSFVFSLQDRVFTRYRDMSAYKFECSEPHISDCI